jgi:hypothetical protein
MPAVPLSAATLVDAKYPHTGVRHPMTPDNNSPNRSEWYEHTLPSGRIAVAGWFYEGADARRRTIVAFRWNDPTSPVLTAHNIHFAAAASHKTNELLAELDKS